MKKIDLGHTIQIVANVGVIAGIVFLALELRQNSEVLSYQARSSLIATKVAQQLPVITNDGGLAAAWIKDDAGEPLTAVENFQLRVMRNMTLETYAALYREVAQGLLSEADIPIRQWASTLQSRRMREYWEVAKVDQDPSFIQFVENVVLAHDLSSYNVIE